MTVRRHRFAAPLRLAALAAVLATVLAGCSTQTGDDVAVGAADEVAENITAQMQPWASRDREADWLVATLIPEPGAPQPVVHRSAPVAITVDALAWQGTTRGDGTATVELRVRADAESFSPGSIGQQGYPAGSAVRCYRVTVTGQRGSEQADLEHIGCPDGSPPARPTPTVPPPLDEPEAAALLEIVGAAAPTRDGATTLAAQLELRFPSDAYVVETDFADQRLIAAVGLADSPIDCLVVVRPADGAPERVGGFPPEWLMPGETGCSTRLVTAPPR